jgi:hypothetical protein
MTWWMVLTSIATGLAGAAILAVLPNHAPGVDCTIIPQ